MSPGHFAPGDPSHATIPFRQLRGAAFAAAAYAFEEGLSCGHVRPAPRQTRQSELLKSS
jgi:hypothetical protein